MLWLKIKSGYNGAYTIFFLPETIVPFEKTSSVVLSLSIFDTPPVIKIPFSMVVEALRYLEMLKKRDFCIQYYTGCKSQIRKIFEFKIWKESIIVLKQTINCKKPLILALIWHPESTCVFKIGF